MLEPPLVLMDEPLSNLDAALRLDMRAEIRRIHQEYGLTTLYVTHDQEEALSLADRLVVLNQGRVAQIGTPAQLYESPGSAHVAAFMGYRNILSLTAEVLDGGLATVAGAGVKLVGTLADARGDDGPVVTVGGAVRVAVRPEDVRIAADGADVAFEAVAEVVEYHGREFQIDALTPAGQRVHLRTPERVAPGDALSLTVDPRRALVFAADGEQA